MSADALRPAPLSLFPKEPSHSLSWPSFVKSTSDALQDQVKDSSLPGLRIAIWSREFFLSIALSDR